MQTRHVRRTRDFERVAALPRRVLDLAVAARAAEAFTREFARRPSVALLPMQGQGLWEGAEQGGLFGGGLAVGSGKTLLLELLPAVMRANRSVLIVPAAGDARGKTYADRYRYGHDWRLPRNPSIVLTVEELQTEKQAKVLRDIDPDLLLIDECDRLANSGASVAHRVDRFVLDSDRRGRRVAVCAVTGTPSRLSIMGYWHLLCWCLGAGAPVPLNQGEAELWSDAIDAPSRTRGLVYTHPGPLGHTVEAAREWYSQRLVETPGVLFHDRDSAEGIPLYVDTALAPEDPDLDRAFYRFLHDFENPDGTAVTEPLERWSLDGDLGLGLYPRWDPPPPLEWRLAARDVMALVRDRIARSQSWDEPLDTERQVLRRYRDDARVVRWLAVKDAFHGTRVPVWFTRSTLDYCLAWLRARPGSIVWTGSVPFGARLAEEAGVEFFSQGGGSWGGQLHSVRPGASMVVSVRAGGRVFNLQGWRDHLVVKPPQSAKEWEQLLGRAHRQGQTDAVRFTVLLTSGGTADVFERAIREARRVKACETLTQKLLRADIVRADVAARAARGSLRWATAHQDNEQEH